MNVDIQPLDTEIIIESQRAEVIPGSAYNLLESHVLSPDPHSQYLKSESLIAGNNIEIDTSSSPGNTIINSVPSIRTGTFSVPYAAYPAISGDTWSVDRADLNPIYADTYGDTSNITWDSGWNAFEINESGMWIVKAIVRLTYTAISGEWMHFPYVELNAWGKAASAGLIQRINTMETSHLAWTANEQRVHNTSVIAVHHVTDDLPWIIGVNITGSAHDISGFKAPLISTIAVEFTKLG